MFDSWSQSEQVHFVQSLLLRMCHQQHGQIDTFLKPMLQRDFISSLPGELTQQLECIYTRPLTSSSAEALELVLTHCYY